MLKHILKKNDEKKSSVFGAFKHVDQLHRAPPYTASSSSKKTKSALSNFYYLELVTQYSRLI